MKKPLQLRQTPVDLPIPQRLPAVMEIAIPDRFSDVGKFEAAVSEQWRRIETATLHLGRLLNAGRESFAHGDFEDALGRISETVGASPRVLRQAMRLAAGIPGLPGDAHAWEQVPSLADEVLTAQRRLPQERWNQAVRDGVISPASTVKALRAFVQSAVCDDNASPTIEHEAAGRSGAPVEWTPEALAQEITRLENEEKKLTRQINTTRQRLSALRDLLPGT